MTGSGAECTANDEQRNAAHVKARLPALACHGEVFEEVKFHLAMFLAGELCSFNGIIA